MIKYGVTEIGVFVKHLREGTFVITFCVDFGLCLCYNACVRPAVLACPDVSWYKCRSSVKLVNAETKVVMLKITELL